MFVTRNRAADEAGLTIMELVMAMVLMGIFGSIFAAGVVQMYKAANGAEATQSMQSRLNTVFERLDAEIRYSAAISTPSTTSTPTVGYLNIDGAERRCTQLRVADGKLLRRSWKQEATPPTTWTKLATDLEPTTTPFEVEETSNQRQRMRITLTAAFAGEKHQTEFLFTALNATVSATNKSICMEGSAS